MTDIGIFDGFTVASDIPLQVSETAAETAPQVWEYTFVFSWDPSLAAQDPILSLVWKTPEVDVFHSWFPGTGTNRAMRGNWKMHQHSQLTSQAPVGVLMNDRDMNRITAAVTEVRKVLSLRLGLEDYNDLVECRIEMGLRQFGSIGREKFTVRIDRRDIRYEQALRDVCAWWDAQLGLKPFPVPQRARMPFYSSWYAFHTVIRQEILECECEIAGEMGMEAILLDDGWQTEITGVGIGYANNGDWNVATGKFPDFAAFVRKAHSCGLKLVLWFAVPFIGRGAKNFERFRDKVLYMRGNDLGVLDPRYPDVRQYLLDTFMGVARRYDLDGMKLDFVDSIRLGEENRLDPAMDYICVQEAAERLMQDIADAMLAFKPDALIEFRQSYIGPAMRRFGNLFRVGDCASEISTNRVGVVDLRLLAWDRAIHGDMLSWHNDDSTENAALQLQAVLFGVIQLSKILAEMTPDQRRMAEFWIAFAKKHEKVLQESAFMAEEPQYLYPVIRAWDDSEEIIGVYDRKKTVRISPSRGRITVVNAKQEDCLYLEPEEACRAVLTVYNLYGECLRREECSFPAEPCRIACPQSGFAELVFVRA